MCRCAAVNGAFKEEKSVSKHSSVHVASKNLKSAKRNVRIAQKGVSNISLNFLLFSSQSLISRFLLQTLIQKLQNMALNQEHQKIPDNLFHWKVHLMLWCWQVQWYKLQWGYKHMYRSCSLHFFVKHLRPKFLDPFESEYHPRNLQSVSDSVVLISFR